MDTDSDSSENNSDVDFTNDEDDTIYDSGYIHPSDYERIGGTELSKVGNLETPLEISKKRVAILLKEPAYYEFSENDKTRAYKLIEEMPEEKIITYNMEIMTAASLFKIKFGGANKENIQKFIKMTDGLKSVNHLDFIRYVRILTGQ